MPPQATDQHGASLEALCADITEYRHVITVSNRGPVSFTDGVDGVLPPRPDSGQVPGGLGPLRGLLPVAWVSAATTGADRTAAEQAGDEPVTRGLPPGWSARFITPSRRAYHRFYNTICNPLLWFLHHRSWGYTHTPNIDREAHTAWEQGFVPVSAAFAEAVAAEAARTDRPAAVLIRDYHLHLVSGMVRKLLPDSAVHFQLDVPWPGPADWRMTPAHWRDAIFESILASDVVGFTSIADAHSFMAGVEEFFPQVRVDRPESRIVGTDGHSLLVRSYPPQIDHSALLAAASSHRTEALERRLSMAGRHTFVTAERAEPHKNIVRCIRAYGALLNRDRSLAASSRYLLVLAPPPPHLAQYRRYVSEIEKAANEVNSKHGQHGRQPVELVIENDYPMALAAMLCADTLVAVPVADAICSTAFATPLINTRDCSLIVSETASSAEVFGNTAATVSPSDVETLSNEMMRAETRSPAERKELFAKAESAVLAIADGASLTAQMTDVRDISHRSVNKD